MLVGMLIAISIVREKADNTINTINVTPISQMVFAISMLVFFALKSKIRKGLS